MQSFYAKVRILCKKIFEDKNMHELSVTTLLKANFLIYVIVNNIRNNN